MQKYGSLANEVAAPEFVCEICGTHSGFNWSDLHGEGMCNQRGVPYDLKVSPHKLNIKEEWIPAVKAYWSEAARYMGLGTIIIWHDYPEAEQGRKEFFEWCDKHPDLVPKP